MVHTGAGRTATEPADAASQTAPTLPSLQLQALRYQARTELRAAVKQCQQRGLYYAARWSAHTRTDHQTASQRTCSNLILLSFVCCFPRAQVC